MSQPSTATTLGKFRKTRLCTHFQEGACRSGSSCSFAHSQAELASAPNLSKTKLCFDFFRQNCNDKNCKFAHGYNELRGTGDVYKTQICHGFQSGFCRFGANCRFVHGKIDVGTEATKLTPPAPKDLPLPSVSLTKFVLERSSAPSGIQSTHSPLNKGAIRVASQLPIWGDRCIYLADPMWVDCPAWQPEMEQQFNDPLCDGLPLLLKTVESDIAFIRLEQPDFAYAAVPDFSEAHSEQAWFGGSEVVGSLLDFKELPDDAIDTQSGSLSAEDEFSICSF